MVISPALLNCLVLLDTARCGLAPDVPNWCEASVVSALEPLATDGSAIVIRPGVLLRTRECCDGFVESARHNYSCTVVGSRPPRESVGAQSLAPLCVEKWSGQRGRQIPALADSPRGYQITRLPSGSLRFLGKRSEERPRAASRRNVSAPTSSGNVECARDRYSALSNSGPFFLPCVGQSHVLISCSRTRSLQPDSD